MQGVLFICHGSRRQHSCVEANVFMDECKKEFAHIPIVEYGFLELAAPTISDAFEKCVKQGVTKLAVIPFLLLKAGHVTYDIPKELVDLQERYPQIQVTYGHPIGVTQKMSQLVLDKVADVESITKDTQVIIVGRGSRMTEVQTQLEEIIAPVKSLYSSISISYLYGCKPSFQECFTSIIASSSANIVVVPYMIFSGVLTESIEETVNRLNTGKKRVVITSPLATHPLMKSALLDRVVEAI